MASLLIKGGRVVSPEDGLDGNLDVLVENGVVRRVAPDLALRADETVDARGQVVSPGFIDLHVHLREPGDSDSETLETGLAAAVAGGVHRRLCDAQHASGERLRPVHSRPDRAGAAGGTGASVSYRRCFCRQR